jgi:hypothetical protein
MAEYLHSLAERFNRLKAGPRASRPGPVALWQTAAPKETAMPRPRCERCQRPLDHCLCPLIPALDSRTRVICCSTPVKLPMP